MKGLYVLGGRQKKTLLNAKQEWHLYERALILELDPESGAAKVRVDYETPLDARAAEDPSILFKSGTLRGHRLYACTSTEALIYELPQFKCVGYVSLPCFNDLHHVRPNDQDNLLIANTGLDMVVESTPQGEVLRQWNVLGEDPWRRFSREIDYRKIASTKPHRSHPNYVFQLGSDVWVTRNFQKDAVCLTRSTRPIAIDVEKPHDGDVTAHGIYFTTVDGHVVVVDPNTLQVRTIVDLKLIDNDSRALLGWCRGLLVLDEARVWVGFTRVRKTRFRENISWVKRAFRDGVKPTHIALYDLSAGKCLAEIDLERHGMNVVYSIFPAESCQPMPDSSKSQDA